MSLRAQLLSTQFLRPKRTPSLLLSGFPHLSEHCLSPDALGRVISFLVNIIILSPFFMGHSMVSIVEKERCKPERLLPLCLVSSALPSAVASLALVQCYLTLLASFRPFHPFSNCSCPIRSNLPCDPSMKEAPERMHVVTFERRK